MGLDCCLEEEERCAGSIKLDNITLGVLNLLTLQR